MASSAPIVVSEMTDEEFERRTLDLIQKEFGMKGVVRFIRAYRSGRGDYTAERQQNPSPLTLEEIWRDMEAQGLTQKS